jgi:hypothetical protein
LQANMQYTEHLPLIKCDLIVHDQVTLDKRGRVRVFCDKYPQVVVTERADMQEQQVESQVVNVFGQSEQVAYARTVSMREVTFTCVICDVTVTQLRYPSRLPRYCSERCKMQREEQRNEERVRKQREKRQRAREAGRQ